MGAVIQSAFGGIKVRRTAFAPKDVIAHYRADGVIVLRSPLALTDVAHSIVDYLERWARETPETIFLAQRDAQGRWETLSYAVAWNRVQALGQAFLERGLGPTTPIAILSSASLEHALVTFAGLLVGVPVAPISPSYGLLPGAISRLEQVAAILRPGLVFVQSTGPFARARSLPDLAGATWLSGTAGEESATYLADLYATAPGAALTAARAAVGPDTIAKILFTSGSTGAPKGVINTQRMLCSAVQASALAVPPDGPVVQLEWMPWHHTMAGNATLNGVLRAGGTLYIDEGRPTPELFERTIQNLREVQPTSLQSVPAAYQMLVGALEQDDDLRRAFFHRLKRMTYAGASLPQDVWTRMQGLAVQTVGEQIAFGSGYGTTETSPGISVTHWPSEGHGEIGLPLPGLALKLVPVDGQYEVRVSGPNVTPGYYGRPDLTAQAFDDEGYYRVGDLVRFVDAANPSLGLRFAGRLSENFKLTSGSWVATGELRLKVLEACRPLVADVVVAGHDRDDIRLMLWPHADERRRLGAGPDEPLAPEAYARLSAAVAARLQRYNLDHAAKTHQVAAFRILQDPPSMGAGETTDKGYINQRGVLAERAALVAELYDPAAGDEVVRL